MTDKIKKAISILEVNKLISSSQTEFCESVDLAIQALEKQIPKKVIWKKDVHGVGRRSCPNCKEHYISFPYCPLCGQNMESRCEDDI